MNPSFENILCICCLLLSGSVYAQVPQDLIDKMEAAGMSDMQIQQGLAERMKQEGGSVGSQATATDAKVSDRIMPVVDEEQSLGAQRRNNLPAPTMENTVFGHEIFSNRNLSFASDLNIPTPKNYVLPANGELLINVWRDSELNLKLRISPDGTIFIPNLGPVSVSGLTIAGVGARLCQELSQIMSTLSGSGEGNIFVSISLSQIRSMKMNIVDEVVAPGMYTLPLFATLSNTSYAAGGVNKIGSLRSIKVYRNSKEIANLDVYDYLLNGKYITNVRLEKNNMIMIDPYDQLAVVRGKVKRNRIFELRKGETLRQLSDMAGGFTDDAYTKDVQMKRRSDSRYQISTVSEDKFASFVMQDGDSLQVDSVIPFYENRLVMMGAIRCPGEYELSPSVRTVKQLVKQATGLKGDEFTGRALITRLDSDFTITMIAVNIRGILNGAAPDVELQAEDQLSILSLFDLREPYTIKAGGAANYPDTVFPYRHNLTIEDAIMMAGDLRESASSINVEVARRTKDSSSDQNVNRIADVYNFSLSEDLKLNAGDTIFTLEPFDGVYVRFSPGYHEQQVVKVNGKVTFAGSCVLAMKNARLSDIIAKAGGVTSEPYVKDASLKRQLTEDELKRMETLLASSEANEQSRDSIGVALMNMKDYSVGIDLEKVLANLGSIDDVVLHDGGEPYIPQMQSMVKMSGAMTHPNSVTYTKGMSVIDCLSQAGGYGDIVHKYPTVIYMNGEVAMTKCTAILFKRYPKVEPGCEIVVPTKTQRERRSLAEIMSISSSATSMAAMITSIVNMIKN